MLYKVSDNVQIISWQKYDGNKKKENMRRMKVLKQRMKNVDCLCACVAYVAHWLKTRPEGFLIFGLRLQIKA